MISAVHWVILELAILCIPPCSLFQPPKLTLYTLGGLPPHTHTHTHNRTQQDIIPNTKQLKHVAMLLMEFWYQCSGFQALSLSPAKTIDVKYTIDRLLTYVKYPLDSEASKYRRPLQFLGRSRNWRRQKGGTHLTSTELFSANMNSDEMRSFVNPSPKAGAPVVVRITK